MILTSQSHHDIIYVFTQAEADELIPIKQIQEKIFPLEIYSVSYLGKLSVLPSVNGLQAGGLSAFHLTVFSTNEDEVKPSDRAGEARRVHVPVPLPQVDCCDQYISNKTRSCSSAPKERKFLL